MNEYNEYNHFNSIMTQHAMNLLFHEFYLLLCVQIEEILSNFYLRAGHIYYNDIFAYMEKSKLFLF